MLDMDFVNGLENLFALFEPLGEGVVFLLDFLINLNSDDRIAITKDRFNVFSDRGQDIDLIGSIPRIHERAGVEAKLRIGHGQIAPKCASS